MYYIDTMALNVVAYDYDVKTGSITKERTVLEFTKNEGCRTACPLIGPGCFG